MTTGLFLALAGFAIATSITPGPNNIMLLASGMNYGLMRSIPHMLGVVFGFTTLLVGAGFGIGQMLEAQPALLNVLRAVCAAYLVYLAWRIARSGSPDGDHQHGKPMTFLAAAAFQWINPKGWFMAVTAMAVYTSVDRYVLSAMVVVAVFAAIALPCSTLWCASGAVLRRWLSDPARLRIFNFAMAALLLGSLLLVLI
jgi:threonine/homoserine/homoserine lactone efflux protein